MGLYYGAMKILLMNNKNKARMVKVMLKIINI